MASVATVNGIRYISTTQESEQMIAAMATSFVSASTLFANGPQPLEVQSTTVVSAGSGTFDVLAEVKNPSDAWALRVASYTIMLEGTVLGTGTASFFPGETRTLAIFSVSPQRVSPQANVTVSFADYEWRNAKIDPSLDLIDVGFSQTKLATFSPVTAVSVSRVTGVFENRSVVALKEVPIIIFVRRGTTILGAGQMVMTNVLPKESRSIDFRFPTFLNGTSATLEAAIPLSAVIE